MFRKRLVSKHGPLLVCFAHEFEDDKTTVIFHSNLLHRHNQYSLLSIKAKFEWEKHAKLVNELKERKAKGEINLITRNGRIISRPTCTVSNLPSQGIDHDHSSQSS